MFGQQVGGTSTIGRNSLFLPTIKSKAQHGGRKAAGAEHIGNKNQKYRANSYPTSKTGKKRNLNDLLAHL